MGVTDDTNFRRIVFANLIGIYIDVNQLGGWNVKRDPPAERRCRPIGEAASHRENDVRLASQGVARYASQVATRPGVEIVVLGDRSLPHPGYGYRRAKE